MNCHHKNEDDKLNPFIRTKVEYPEKLEKDHEYLVQCMDEIESCITETPILMNKLLLLWENYTMHMYAHVSECEPFHII